MVSAFPDIPHSRIHTIHVIAMKDFDWTFSLGAPTQYLLHSIANLIHSPQVVRFQINQIQEYIQFISSR